MVYCQNGLVLSFFFYRSKSLSISSNVLQIMENQAMLYNFKTIFHNTGGLETSSKTFKYEVIQDVFLLPGSRLCFHRNMLLEMEMFKTFFNIFFG